MIKNESSALCPYCRQETTWDNLIKNQENLTVYGIYVKDLIKYIDWEKLKKDNSEKLNAKM